MKTRRALLLLSVLLALSAAQAAPSSARLSLKSEGPGDLVVISNADDSKLVNVTPKALSVDQPVTANAWTKSSITFKVTKESVVRLRLSGSWVKEGHIWVMVDNVHANGATIGNPDFETGLHKTAAPDGWKFLRNDAAAASTICDATLAASGQVCVKVSNSSPVIQRFSVRPDAAITITYSARLAPQP